MNNVINFNIPSTTDRCTLASCNCSDGRKPLTNKTAQDVEATLHMEHIFEKLDGRSSWMQKLDSIPDHLQTGDHETDVTGIALSMNNLGEKVAVALGGFEIIVDFFNLQLMTLDEVQRERVLGNLSKHTATALLLLDFSEKLKAAELGPMVDEVLKARC